MLQRKKKQGVLGLTHGKIAFKIKQEVTNSNRQIQCVYMENPDMRASSFKIHAE